jgi:hypothetical protein
VLAQTLEDWLPSLITNLTWVTPDQQGQLGTDWFDLIRGKLDEVWPDWSMQTDPALHAQWLSDWWDTLTAPEAAAGVAAGTADGADAEAEAVDVTDLDWVTPQQQELLETEVGPDSGPWRVWLPAELDARWPEWTDATPEELTKRLDTLIGLMAVPSSDALIAEAEEIANKIDARLDDRPEIAEYMAEFSPEELTEIFMEAFGTSHAA